MDIDPNLHFDALAKRRLELGEDEESADDQTGDISKTTSNHDMNVDGLGQKTITLGTEKENERTCSKKDGANPSSLGSAASHEESVRLQ
jgi:hypothetical protein